MPSRSEAGSETWARPAAISAVTSSSLTAMPRRFASCPRAHASMSPSATFFLKPIALSWPPSAYMPRSLLEAWNHAAEMHDPFTSATHCGPVSPLIWAGRAAWNWTMKTTAIAMTRIAPNADVRICSRGLQRGRHSHGVGREPHAGSRGGHPGLYCAARRD